jgi:hypothetical protein
MSTKSAIFHPKRRNPSDSLLAGHASKLRDEIQQILGAVLGEPCRKNFGHDNTNQQLSGASTFRNEFAAYALRDKIDSGIGCGSSQSAR